MLLYPLANQLILFDSTKWYRCDFDLRFTSTTEINKRNNLLSFEDLEIHNHDFSPLPDRSIIPMIIKGQKAPFLFGYKTIFLSFQFYLLWNQNTILIYDFIEEAFIIRRDGFNSILDLSFMKSGNEIQIVLINSKTNTLVQLTFNLRKVELSQSSTISNGLNFGLLKKIVTFDKFLFLLNENEVFMLNKSFDLIQKFTTTEVIKFDDFIIYASLIIVKTTHDYIHCWNMFGNPSLTTLIFNKLTTLAFCGYGKDLFVINEQYTLSIIDIWDQLSIVHEKLPKSLPSSSFTSSSCRTFPISLINGKVPLFVKRYKNDWNTECGMSVKQNEIRMT